MCEQFFNEILRIVVSQICQTIGYSNSQATSLEVLQDTLHKFLYELSRDLHRQVEHGNRTEANLNDAWRSLKNLDIRLNDIMDYINNVEPLSFAFDIPIYPLKKNSNLNFLKPGSKEVLTRPVHVYEYLPPMLPMEQSNLNQFAIISNSLDKINNLDYASEIRKEKNMDTNKESTNVKTKIDIELHDKITVNKSCDDNESILSIVPSLRSLDEEGKPTREISSVVMTSGGFLSPAIEGKLPEIYIPNTIEHFRGLDTPIIKPVSRPSSRLSNENGVSLNIQDKKIEKRIEMQYLSEAKEKPNSVQSDSHLKIEDSNGTIVNNSLINANINSISKKPNITQSSQSPTIASRLLKKAKRKNNSLVSVQQGKFHRMENQINTNEKELNYTGQQNEKTYKKYLKILQKITKSAKETKDIHHSNLTYPKKRFKEPINPNLIATMPIGPERLQMEKLLKKQIKHKQKIMKKQIEKDLQKKILENIKHKDLSLEEKIQNVHSLQSNTSLFDIKMIKQKPEAEVNNQLLSQKNTLYSDTAFLQNILHTTNESNLMQSNQELKKGNMKIFNSLPVGIKLSMEPDRNKLNIFKKISKQKASKVNLLNESSVPSNQIFNCQQNQVINLPSGTTITPAPLGLSEKVQPLAYTNLALTNENKEYLEQYAVPNEIAFSNVKNKETQDHVIPKKRGRKPGSKNQVKIPNLTNVDNKANKKKQKKVKVINGVNSVGKNENSDICEPLNLTNHNQFGVMDDFVSKFSLGISNNLEIKQSLNYQSQIKQKEKKKIKTKNSAEISANTNNVQIELKVPSKEEVNNINKKLSLIDTELKPESTSNISGLVFNDTNKSTHSQQNLSQKPNASKLVCYKKGIQQEEFTNISISNLKTSFLPQNNGGTPNFPGKMPVMPFYPFSSQPGLIPTPGLFGTSSLRNLSNHVNDVPANMLLTRFLPYTPFNQQSMEDLSPKGIRSEQTSKTVSPTLRTGGDLTYCNVAPLIPESMNLSSVGQSSHNRQENFKAMKTFDFAASPENKEILLKSHEKIKETRNPVLLETINSDKNKQSFCEEISRKNVSQSESVSYKSNVSQMEKTNIKVNTFTQDPIMKKINQMEIVQHTGLPVLNINEPIEVSDESVDDTLKGIHIESVSNAPKQNSLQKMGQILCNSTVPNDIFGPNKTEIMEVCIRDPKKTKKPKQIKNNPFSHTSSNLILDVFGVENDVVGKLAGGADLIPVTGTGMAYSSKTIPSTSLTASTTSSVFPVMNKNNLGGINPIKNLSNTSISNIDLQKKRKEHKKLKKIKEGKIKKKKDKKDRSKNKLKIEKHLNNEDKLFKEKSNDKELLKKCKKGKKKEKQRPILQNPIINTSNNGMAEDDVLYKNSTNTICEKLHSEIPLKLNATESTCIVPRLTLKLANCHSTDVNSEKVTIDTSIENILGKRELSPELARISPLVTRPPKQKSITGENIQTSSITTSGSNTILDPVSDNKIIKTINTSSLSQPLVLPPSPWLPGGTITASSVLLPQQLSQLVKNNDNIPCTSKTPKLTQDEHQAALETKNPSISESSRPSSYIDAEGNRVWICPACGKVDDGSAMIGCDGCDAWYHWVCVGIFVAPKENEDWFCRVCITRKKTINSSDKKRKRNKKK